MVAVFVCFSDPQFADDTAFGKKFFHLLPALLVRDYAFVQLSVPFSAGSESISFSLSVRARGYGSRSGRMSSLDFEDWSAHSQQRASTAERADSNESARYIKHGLNEVSVPAL
jgi:hypothetical protein